jgi:spore coat polysaccharide biosynthesis protein SpsF
VIGAIIQARMGSQRLPGKVMMEIKQKPVLHYVLNQVSHAKKLSKIIVATSMLKQDDVIFNFCKANSFETYRGHPTDVLDRFYNCAKEHNLDTIVRITADCPFIDYEIIDKCISNFDTTQSDYLSNTVSKFGNTWKETYNGFPIGFAVEVFSFDALQKAWKNGKKSSDREHVTEYIWQHPEYFKINCIENNKDLSKIRLVVDYENDFKFIKSIIENSHLDLFTLSKILKLMKTNSV